MKDEMSTDELAALLGCSAEKVRELTRRHVLAKVGRSYPVAESVRRAMAHLRAGAAARSGPASAGVALQRARKLKLEADMLERESQISSGAVVAVADVEANMTMMCRALRTMMLSVAGRVAGRAVHFTRDDITLVDDEVRAALLEASEMDMPKLRALANARELAA